jgi:tetratricopeptide (TPR) repeat protein
MKKAYYNLEKLKSDYEDLKKAESLTNSEKDLMFIYNEIGKILYKMDQLDNALSYFERSLSLAKELNDTNMQANTLNNIAIIHAERRELYKALSYCEESLNLQTNEKEKANTYKNMALIYNEKGDYQEAVKYFQKAIEISEKYEEYHSVSMYKLDLGNTYRKMKDYENAEKYLFESLEVFRKLENKHGEALGYWALGWFYENKEDKKIAREYYKHAYDLFESIGAKEHAQAVLNEIEKLDKSN